MDAERLAHADAARYKNTSFQNSVLILPEPDRSGFRDPEGLFYQALKLAHAGDADRAVEILDEAVTLGFFPFDTFTRHGWLDSLRDRPDFNSILERAEHLHRDARAAFCRRGWGDVAGL